MTKRQNLAHSGHRGPASGSPLLGAKRTSSTAARAAIAHQSRRRPSSVSAYSICTVSCSASVPASIRRRRPQKPNRCPQSRVQSTGGGVIPLVHNKRFPERIISAPIWLQYSLRTEYSVDLPKVHKARIMQPIEKPNIHRPPLISHMPKKPATTVPKKTNRNIWSLAERLILIPTRRAFDLPA